MNIQTLHAFIQSLQEIEHSTQDPQFNLSVKYFGDDFVYSGWPLPRGEYITEKGLRDPGFGSGPVKFEDIEFITVHAVPRRGECTNEYREKFMTLLSKVQYLTQVMANTHEITFKNS